MSHQAHVIERQPASAISDGYIKEIAKMLGESLHAETLGPLRHGGVYKNASELWEAGLRRSVYDATINGQVLTINQSDAIALVYPPGQSPGKTTISESTWYQEQQELSQRNPQRHTFVEEVLFPQLDTLSRATYPGDRKLNSWYVTHLAVRTTCQGTGMGKALLQHLHALAKRDSTSVILEASNEVNITFYCEKMGYTLLQKQHLPKLDDDPPAIWAQFEKVL